MGGPLDGRGAIGEVCQPYVEPLRAWAIPCPDDFVTITVALVIFVSPFPPRRESRGGGSLLYGKTNWNRYYDYAKQDDEKTLSPFHESLLRKYVLYV